MKLTFIHKILSKSYYLYSSILFLILLKKLVNNLFNRNNKLAYSDISKKIYDEYWNREILDYEKWEWIALINWEQKILSFKYIREQYLNILFNKVDELLKISNKINILEIWCWNWINSMLIKQKYKEKVHVTATDISLERMNEWNIIWMNEWMKFFLNN